MPETGFKIVTRIANIDGAEVEVKHYVDGGMMISQRGGSPPDRVYVPADMYAAFVAAMVRPTEETKVRQIKVTLRGFGGELDCRVVDVPEGVDEEELIKSTVQDIVLNCTFAVGDTIAIEEI